MPQLSENHPIAWCKVCTVKHWTEIFIMHRASAVSEVCINKTKTEVCTNKT